MRRASSRGQGFTLIELLVVIAIIQSPTHGTDRYWNPSRLQVYWDRGNAIDNHYFPGCMQEVALYNLP